MDRGGLEVLSAARMARADSATIAAGTSGVALMEHAAAAVAPRRPAALDPAPDARSVRPPATMAATVSAPPRSSPTPAGR